MSKVTFRKTNNHSLGKYDDIILREKKELILPFLVKLTRYKFQRQEFVENLKLKYSNDKDK